MSILSFSIIYYYLVVRQFSGETFRDTEGKGRERQLRVAEGIDMTRNILHIMYERQCYNYIHYLVQSYKLKTNQNTYKIKLVNVINLLIHHLLCKHVSKYYIP